MKRAGNRRAWSTAGGCRTGRAVGVAGRLGGGTCGADTAPLVGMRYILVRRCIHNTFPFGSWPSRKLDLDPVRPYRRDGSPGQTFVDGLQPLIRRGHRAKTHGKWQVEPEPQGGHLWRSPLGLLYRVLPDGRTYRVKGGTSPAPLRPWQVRLAFVIRSETSSG